MKIVSLTSKEFNLAFSKLISASLPPKTSFKLKKIALAVADEVKVFEEVRTELIQEYGVKDENGQITPDEKGMINLDVSRKDEFQPKMQELADMEVSVEIPKISLDELGDKVELSVTDLIALESIVCE